MTSFPAFTLLFVQKQSCLYNRAFERLFCPEGREFEQGNLQISNARGVARGVARGDVEASI